MTPWLLFGAGGKGVGARTLELALTEHVRSSLSFAVQTLRLNWRNKVCRFLLATLVTPA